MNKLGTRLLQRDPLISTATLRFFRMASVKPQQFYAGLRPMCSGEYMDVDPKRSRPARVERMMQVHGGSYWRLQYDVIRRRMLLTFIHPKFEYCEYATYYFDAEAEFFTHLTIYGFQVPETILPYCKGRRVSEIVTAERSLFFAAKHTRIQSAETVDHEGSPALQLAVSTKWIRFSRFIAKL